MFQLVNIIKWTSIAVLPMASLFSPYAARYELLLNLVVCLAAAALVHRAICAGRYFEAFGFLAIAVVFSPYALAIKIFLMMGAGCLGTLGAVIAAFRRPVVNRGGELSCHSESTSQGI